MSIAAYNLLTHSSLGERTKTKNTKIYNQNDSHSHSLKKKISVKVPAVIFKLLIHHLEQWEEKLDKQDSQKKIDALCE
jgi:hypothetical protein